jgi:hypothetical protein
VFILVFIQTALIETRVDEELPLIHVELEVDIVPVLDKVAGEVND